MGAQYNEPLLEKEDKEQMEFEEENEVEQETRFQRRCLDTVQAVLIIAVTVVLAYYSWQLLPERGSYLITVRLRLYRSPLLNHFGTNETAQTATAPESPAPKGPEHTKWHNLPPGGKAYQMFLAFTWRWEPPKTFAHIRARFGNLMGLSPPGLPQATEPEPSPQPLFGSSDSDMFSVGGAPENSIRTWISAGRDARHKIVHSVWRYHFVFQRTPRKALRTDRSEHMAMH